MFSMPSGMELVVIIALVVLLFGGKKIPELAKGIGSGIKNFKKAIKEDDEKIEEVAKSETIQNISENSNLTSTNKTV
ncbi:Sec-independent protein translocase subunit TatA/TatB [Arcobacter cloacae]|uniref:Sec-independent protein translocase protein TatA n=1 Tax=Arcobacter cloacae TaxID=1054034 RepID=A0A6M8NPH6_9BACT|nr:twin-arginine translocase TatA/TatE family subunit [Arcobacter cloacae]QKF90347.1 twin arginine translocation system, TatA/E family protein [Arcobacter cloacae]RXI41860.1 twin-arginine translocase TatA/TatE family subunit [Arcobacter cloacae]